MRRSAWLAVALMIPLVACSADDAKNAAGAGGTAGAGAAGAGGTPVTTSSLGGAGGAGAGGGAGSQQLAQGVPDRVLFATDRSSLSPEATATLEKQAAWLAQNPRISVQIAGDADERGTEEYNLALGQRRAGAARDYLVSRGVPASRVSTISYGKDRPVALGSGEDAWAQNRNAITSTR